MSPLSTKSAASAAQLEGFGADDVEKADGQLKLGEGRERGGWGGEGEGEEEAAALVSGSEDSGRAPG